MFQNVHILIPMVRFTRQNASNTSAADALLAGTLNLHIVLKQHFKNGLLRGNFECTTRAGQLDFKRPIAFENLRWGAKVFPIDLLVTPSRRLRGGLNV
ncbi:hypothetical protein UB23_06410 [Pseudomonas sp. ES3-33]|nr:hypothetical protein UB23_06410 [Pseudomonas sp. ES3-33]